VVLSTEIRHTGWKTILEPANTVAKSLSVTDAKTENGMMTIRVVNADGTNVGLLKTLGPVGNTAPKIRILSDMKSTDVPQPGEALLAIEDAWGINLGASEQSLVKNPRPAACYTYGYNPSLYLRKVAVLLALVDSQTSKGLLQSGAWNAEGVSGTMLEAAAVLRPGTLKVPEAQPNFDFARVSGIKDANFLPGAIRFGNTSGLHQTAREASK